MKNIAIGSKVELSYTMKKQCVSPEKYSVGVVTEIGYYHIIDVKWNGIDHAIVMREDEIEPV